MHVAIIGNGAAGVSAALSIRKRQPDWRITIISGESHYHWSRPALMYVFMGHMRYRDTKPFESSLWSDRRIELKRGWIRGVDAEGKRLELHDGSTVTWDRLLIASGSQPNRFGWPGQDLEGVQGLYGLNDLHLLYRNVERTRHAVIVGGGLLEDSTIEIGRGIKVDWQLRASAPDVWAAGDCAEIAADGSGKPMIQQVWYMAKRQGELAGHNIAGDDRVYDAGIWFNSAKFFDLEYHTYGKVGLNVPNERKSSACGCS